MLLLCTRIFLKVPFNKLKSPSETTLDLDLAKPTSYVGFFEDMMLVEAAVSHTFAQRPDTAADVASAAEELATQVCQQGAYIQEKKMPHEARKYTVGSITPVWC